MASKKKKRNKKNIVSDGQKTRSQSRATLLGVTPERLGVVIASAVVGEILQVALNRVSDSDPAQSVRSQLGSVNPVKGAVGIVKDAIADATLRGHSASEQVRDTAEEGREAVTDAAEQGTEVAQDRAEMARETVKNGVGTLVGSTKDMASDTRQFVIEQITEALSGAHNTANGTRHLVEDTVETAKDRVGSTQDAVALVIEEAVEQIKAILADSDFLKSKGDRKKDRKRKKNRRKRNRKD